MGHRDQPADAGIRDGSRTGEIGTSTVPDRFQVHYAEPFNQKTFIFFIFSPSIFEVYHYHLYICKLRVLVGPVHGPMHP